MDHATNNKIESEITNAKLNIAESRITFLLASIGVLGALFGVAIPIFQTIRVDNAVDEVVKRADRKIDELSSIAIRKPELELYDGDVKITSGSTIILNCDSPKTLRLWNNGEGKAEFIKLRSLLDGGPILSGNMETFWSNPEISDDEKFSSMQTRLVDLLYPNDYFRIPLSLSCYEADTVGESSGRLEIYYNDPRELKVSLRVIKRKYK